MHKDFCKFLLKIIWKPIKEMYIYFLDDKLNVLHIAIQNGHNDFINECI